MKNQYDNLIVVYLDKNGYSICNCSYAITMKEAKQFAKYAIVNKEYIDAGLHKVEILNNKQCIYDYFVKL